MHRFAAWATQRASSNMPCHVWCGLVPCPPAGHGVAFWISWSRSRSGNDTLMGIAAACPRRVKARVRALQAEPTTHPGLNKQLEDAVRVGAAPAVGWVVCEIRTACVQRWRCASTPLPRRCCIVGPTVQRAWGTGRRWHGTRNMTECMQYGDRRQAVPRGGPGAARRALRGSRNAQGQG